MSLSVSSSGQRIGTIPYTAPEMLNPADKADTRMTRESDMYGFAGVCYEILTGNVPFHDSPNYANVIWRVVHIGEIPERPADEVCVLRGLTDEMWSIITTCWSRDKTIRLTASEAAKRIHDLPDRPMDTRPAGNWDSAATSQLRSSITDHPFAPSVQHIEAALRSCDPEGERFLPKNHELLISSWAQTRYLFLRSFLSRQGTITPQGQMRSAMGRRRTRVVFSTVVPKLARLRVTRQCVDHPTHPRVTLILDNNSFVQYLVPCLCTIVFWKRRSILIMKQLPIRVVLRRTKLGTI